MDRCSVCEYVGGKHHSQCPVGQAEKVDQVHDQRLTAALARSPADRLNALNVEQRQFLSRHDEWEAAFGSTPDVPLHLKQYDEDGRCRDCGRTMDDHAADGSC